MINLFGLYNEPFILYSSLQMDNHILKPSQYDCPVLREKTNIKSDFDEGCRVLSVSAVGDMV